MTTNLEWTCCLTCQNREDAVVYRKELAKRQQSGLLAKECLTLVVDDPRTNVGSGSATLNALLVIAEHLSARQGFTVVTMDVFKSARILILHMGRDFALDACKRTFMTVPVERTTGSTANLLTNLDLLLLTVTEKIAHKSPPGLWVCSTDMFLDIPQPVELDYSRTPVVMLSTWASLDYACHHGVLKLAADGLVSDIIYQGSDELLRPCTNANGQLQVVSGVVYCNLAVVERLLSLTTLSPLDTCTYVGVDSGTVPVQLSLYFDLLLAMCADVSKADFESGTRAGSYAARYLPHLSPDDLRLTRACRSLVWRELNTFRISPGLIQDGSHVYIQSRGLDHLQQMRDCAAGSASGGKSLHPSIHHAFVESSASVNDTAMLVNTILDTGVTVGPNCLLVDTIVPAGTLQSAVISDGCLVKGLDGEAFSTVSLLIESNMVVQQFRLSNASNAPANAIAIFGTSDYLDIPVTDARATFCNQSWADFFQRTAIQSEDLWHANEAVNARSLMTARLYPVRDVAEGPIQLIDVLWLQPTAGAPSHAILERWRQSTRMSLSDFLAHADINRELLWRCKLYHTVACRIVHSTIVNQRGVKLTGYYDRAVIDGQTDMYFATLDNVASVCQSPGVVARALANIADVFGSLAAGQGGLRSGPSSNLRWKTAFDLLEDGRLCEGVQLMASERSQWTNSADRVIRAARHYERAAQTLIRRAVLTAAQFVSDVHATSSLPDMGVWVMAECAARIDISGGWSDTPPITYEHGGAVINAAILIDGQRPIGAKIKRIPELEVRLCVGESACRVTLTDLQQFADYSQPSAPGALLKAALVYSQIVAFPSDDSLADQLRTKYNGGFELHSWSNLPQGSGLGTSSILAGAILAVLWKITGHVSDVDSLLHGVLIVEQMLTTGGGWQDQVGGLLPGVKVGHSKAALPLKVDVQPIVLSDNFLATFGSHLVLVYTGRTRLARNLLQNVIRNWYARDPDIVQTEDDLVSTAWLCAEAFQKGDLTLIGRCMNDYWEQKKRMAPGCEPTAVSEMMTLLRPHVFGLSMAGAGGGGFLYVLTKQPHARAHVEQLLHAFVVSDGITVHEATIDTVGVLVTLH